MPWKSGGALPRNLVSKKVYRGFNFWYLLSFGFERPFFLTFNQVKALGGSVKKGSKSFEVVFWKLLNVEKEGSIEEIPMLRYYRVFHIDDVEGIPEDKIPKTKSHSHEFNPIEACEKLVNNWQDAPTIRYGQTRAAYAPLRDEILMPDPKTFFEDEKFYSVLFHEITHSTGHRKRLNRHEKFKDHRFGSKDYSLEELVAEMGAAYLCGLCEIENKTIDNSAAYIQSWLSKLKSDNRFIIQASSYAQKAVDYILENQSSPASVGLVEPEKETEVVSFSF
jgi:antirestriction protein ArdC